jgi:hypothetical protein
MNKSDIVISINGKLVALELQERGYYGGSFQIGVGSPASPDISAHVKAIEINVKKSDTMTIAKNDNYQSIIDSWLSRNDDCMPKLLKIGKKHYLISMEVFAS